MDSSVSEHASIEKRLDDLEMEVRGCLTAFAKTSLGVEKLTEDIARLQNLTTGIHERLMGSLATHLEGLVPSHQVVVSKVEHHDKELEKLSQESRTHRDWMHEMEKHELGFKTFMGEFGECRALINQEIKSVKAEVVQLTTQMQDLHDTKILCKGWLLGATCIASILTVVISHFLGFLNLPKYDPNPSRGLSSVSTITNVPGP